jgi:signal transduction histidine kinase
LREVISNLLDNALKYSPAGATVWVRAGLFQESVPPLQGVAIGDTGPGIPQADQARIFERHYRGVQATGTIAGTGLGLAIAHDLVKDMGGRIDLLSPAHLSGLVPEGLSPRPRQEVPSSGQRIRSERDLLKRDLPERDLLKRDLLDRDLLDRDLPERDMISQSPSKNFQGSGTVFIVWLPEAEETPSIGQST